MTKEKQIKILDLINAERIARYQDMQKRGKINKKMLASVLKRF
jgi:hypothetical protein